MSLPLYISRRYLLAKKSHNAINIISAISVVGVAIGTFALVVVMSVFNGFDDLIKTLYNSFDPDIRITAVHGKTFHITDSTSVQLSKIEGVQAWSKVLEENALLKYDEKQYVATIKGVDENYSKINNLNLFITQGKNVLKDKKTEYALVGQGVAYYLQVGLNSISPIHIFLPRKTATITNDPTEAFVQKYIYPSGIFAVEQETDSKYIIVPLTFMHQLLDDTLAVGAIELKFAKNANQKEVHKKLSKLFGSNFKVQNRYEQKETFYQIMNYEKWAIFLILSFILAIASFNVISSLSMLIIEKKKDIATLHSMGADRNLISKIFIFEGSLISLSGAFAGIVVGLLVCWLQTTFGIIQLEGSGSFIIDAYPVSVKWLDMVFIFVTVITIGLFAAWYPVKLIIKRYLPK